MTKHLTEKLNNILEVHAILFKQYENNEATHDDLMIATSGTNIALFKLLFEMCEEIIQRQLDLSQKINDIKSNDET